MRAIENAGHGVGYRLGQVPPGRVIRTAGSVITPLGQGPACTWPTAQRAARGGMPSWGDYFKISNVSGLRRKLLQALNRMGQFEIATICGINARMTI